MPAGELPDVFAGVHDVVPDALSDHLRAIALIDHHVHGTFNAPVDRRTFEAAINEGSTDPVPSFMTQFDSPLGLSIRRWCAPLIGLEPLAGADQYWARRREISPDELSTTMLPAAGVARWIVDTGFKGDLITTPAQLTALSDVPSSEILRLERLTEDLLEDGTSPEDFPEAFRAALRTAVESPEVVGTKTIAAYRIGFDVDWTRPSDADVVAHARDLAERPRPLRVDDALLIAFGVHEAADHGLPIQFHVGFGDRDMDLHRSDPMLLLPLLADDDPGSRTVVALLPLSASGGLPGASLRPRELRRGSRDQLPGRAFPRGWSPKRSRRLRSPSSCTRRTPSVRPSCTCWVRCCGVGRWGWCSASGSARVTVGSRMRSGSST